MNEDWTQACIKIPPGSSFVEKLDAFLREQGFHFDIERVGFVHDDGSFVDYAPCPPPPQ